MVSGFEALPLRTRREVIRLAKKGELHPDNAVRRDSVLWARRILDDRKTGRRFALGMLSDVVVGMLGAGGGASTGGYIANRRAARRILQAAGERPPAQG